MAFVALGDSITYGQGASRPCKSYPSVLAQLFKHSRSRMASVGEILAAPGWTSAALDGAVAANGPRMLTHSSAIIIWIGGDDLAYRSLAAAQGTSALPARQVEGAIRQYAINLGRLIHYIHRVSRAPIFVCTQYNPFPNSPIARAGIGALNNATTAVASKFGATVVPTAHWFEGRQSALISGYRTGTLRDALRPPLPIHPNDAGHRTIAEGLYRVMAPMLRL